MQCGPFSFFLFPPFQFLENLNCIRISFMGPTLPRPSSLVAASPRFKAQKNPRHFAILSSGPFLFFFFLLFNSSKLVRCSMLLKLQLLLLECFSFRPWHYSQYLLKGQLISEWLFGDLNFPKKQHKNLMNLCPRI